MSVCLAPASIYAQSSAHSLHGIIRDSTTGLPVSGAVVELIGDTVHRADRTDDVGEYRLSNAPNGRYRFVVRQIGYREFSRDVRIAGRDTTISVTLRPAPQQLETVQIRAGASGIYGVVGRSQGLQPIAGATVRVIGAARSAITDSAGRFVVNLPKPGIHMVRITRPGYAEQVFTIEVPSDRWIEVARLMDAGSGPTALEGPWQELERRLIWRGMNSALVPGSQLRRYGGSVTDALQGSPAVVITGLRIDRSTCVFVNGLPRPGWPLDAYNVDDIEAVEVYGRYGDATGMLAKRWPPGAPCGDGSSSRPTSGTAGFAVVWLRR